MATYVTSDVHGCLDELFRMLDHVSPNSDDDVWLLGDMCDRGPKSAEALIWAAQAPENFHFLLGNHEDIALDVIARDPNELFMHMDDPWSYNGGTQTADGLLELTSPEWRRDVLLPWMRSLSPFAPIHVGDKDVMLVHAGFDPSRWCDEVRPVRSEFYYGEYNNIGSSQVELGFGQQSTQLMLWVRNGWVDFDGDAPVPVIHGHTPTSYIPWLTDVDDDFDERRIYQAHNRYDVDCGCAYGGRLAMLRLDDMRPWYVDGPFEGLKANTY